MEKRSLYRLWAASALCILILPAIGIALSFLRYTLPGEPAAAGNTSHPRWNGSTTPSPTYPVDTNGIVDVHGRYGQTDCPSHTLAVSNEAECKAVAAIKGWSWRGRPTPGASTMRGCYWLCADTAVAASSCGVIGQWVFYDDDPIVHNQTTDPRTSRICKTTANELILPRSAADSYGIVDTLYTMNLSACPTGTVGLSRSACENTTWLRGWPWIWLGEVTWDSHPPGCSVFCRFTDGPPPYSQSVCPLDVPRPLIVFFNNEQGSSQEYSAPLCSIN
jgi:hypothetical protein